MTHPAASQPIPRSLDELDILTRLEALAFAVRARVGAGVPGAREAYREIRELVARLPGDPL